MNNASKFGVLVSSVMIAMTMCFPAYKFVASHPASGEILVIRDAGHSFIASEPDIPTDKTTKYGSSYQGYSSELWSAKIDYARMGIYCALSVVVGVICGLLATFRSSKKNSVEPIDGSNTKKNGAVPHSEGTRELFALNVGGMQDSAKQVIEQKESTSSLKSNPFFRHSVATVCAFVGLIAGALAIEFAAESGMRLPVFTPAALALGAFFLVTKIILPATE